MARAWIVAGVALMALVGAGIVVFVATRDDGEGAAGPAPGTVTSTTTTPAPSTTAPTTTTLPPGVTAPGATAPATATTAPPAGTAPGSCGAEIGSIEVAVDAGVPNARAAAQVTACRLAAADPTWALVRLDAQPGATFTPTTVVLHGGAGSWSIVDSGTGNVGCGKAPQQVLADLGLLCTGSGA